MGGRAGRGGPVSLRLMKKSKSIRSTKEAIASSIAASTEKPPHCTSRRVLSTCTLAKPLACSTSAVCMLAFALRSTWIRKSCDGS